MPLYEEGLPITHKRTILVEEARNDTFSSLLVIRKKYSLTTTEYLQILTEEIQTTLKYCLRAERHPEDTSKPADLE